jgi:outer membrane protein TolC
MFDPVIRGIVPAVLLAASLAGCASSALVLAPEGPDVPFKPNDVVNADRQDRSAPSEPTPTSRARDFALPPMAGLPLAAPPMPVERAHTYSLAELIDLAQSSNPETRIAWEHARQAALAVGIVKALYLPVLSATAVGGGQHNAGSTQGALASISNSGDLNGTVSSVALEWLIFDFGERDGTH